MSRLLVIVCLSLRMTVALAVNVGCSEDSLEEAASLACRVATCSTVEEPQFVDCVQQLASNCSMTAYDPPTTLEYRLEFKSNHPTLIIDDLNSTFSDEAILCSSNLTFINLNESFVILIVKVNSTTMDPAYWTMDPAYWTIVGSKEVTLSFMPACKTCFGISVAIFKDGISENDFRAVDNVVGTANVPTFNLTDMDGEISYNSSTYCFTELHLKWSIPEEYKNLNSSSVNQFHIRCNAFNCRHPNGHVEYSKLLTLNSSVQNDQVDFVYFDSINWKPKSGPNSKYTCEVVVTLYDDCVIRCFKLDSITFPIYVDASGRSPGTVDNVTIIPDGLCFNISWLEPSITNGKITEYTVEVIEEVNAKNETSHREKISLQSENKLQYCCRHCRSVDHLLLFVNVLAKNEYGILSEYGKTAVYEYTEQPTTPSAEELQLQLVLGVSLPVLVVLATSLLIVIAVIFKIKRRNGKSKVNLLLQEGCSHPYFQKNPPLPADRWTISMSSFDPDSFHLLGEGTFSSVYFSTIQGPLSTPTNLPHYKNCVQHPLAVKICKETSTENEIIAFENECEIYKHLSIKYCPYVLQLVGLQLQTSPPMIAMELAHCGNLLDILQNSTLVEKWDIDKDSYYPRNLTEQLQKREKQITLTEFERKCEENIDSYVVLKEGYKWQTIETNDAMIMIKSSHLIKFIIQITRGMEFLISEGVLHRDIACRNFVLSNGIVKIADFGFACFLNDQKYVEVDLPADSKPFRWMSPEAFNLNHYSEASEVWSFGISMWEIFTQGCFPYYGLSDAEVLEAIQGGQFLECPEICDEKIYNVMLQCWNINQADRPTFAALTRTLEEFMYELYPYMEMAEEK